MKRFLPILCALLAALATLASGGLADDRPAVAFWSFDGTLTDRSGRDNHAFAPPAACVASHEGQALQCQGEPAVVPDSPELRPAPGLRIECWAKLDALGTSWQPLLLRSKSPVSPCSLFRQPTAIAFHGRRWTEPPGSALSKTIPCEKVW